MGNKRASRQLTQEREQEVFNAESNDLAEKPRDLKRRKQNRNDDATHNLSPTKGGKSIELQSALDDSTVFEPDAPRTKSRKALTAPKGTQPGLPRQRKRKAPEDGSNECRDPKRKRTGVENGASSRPSTVRLPKIKGSQSNSHELTHNIKKPTKKISAPKSASSKKKTVARGRKLGSKMPRILGLDSTLPPMHDITQIFEDMTTTGFEKLGLRDAIAHFDSRPLRVATMCSGTESPLLALQMISDGMFPNFSEGHTTPH